MSLTLYHNPISTCSQKVRLALAEKGVGYEQHTIDWSKQDHLSDWYLAINPNGVVPALVHDGKAIVDSSVICEYLDEVFPDPSLGPRDPVGRAQMRAWMRYSEEVPTTAIRVPSFNKLFARRLKSLPAEAFEALTARMPLRKHFYRDMGAAGFSESTEKASIERLQACLGRMNSALSDGRPFLMGGYSIADIVIVPTIVRMEDLALDHMWRDLPFVAGWYARVQSRPSFAQAYPEGARVDPAMFAPDAYARS